MLYRTLLLLLVFSLFLSCASNKPESRVVELPKGGRIGISSLSEYPSQSLAPHGIRAIDGRFIQCYALGNPTINICYGDSGVESFVINTIVEIAFFDSNGVLTTPPNFPETNLLITRLEPTSIGAEKKELPADVGNPEMEFRKDQASQLLPSLVAGGMASPIAQMTVSNFRGFSFEQAYLFIGPEIISFLFTGEFPIMLVGRPNANR